MFVCLWDVLECGSGWPSACFVARVCLELMSSSCLILPSVEITGMCYQETFIDGVLCAVDTGNMKVKNLGKILILWEGRSRIMTVKEKEAKKDF